MTAAALAAALLLDALLGEPRWLWSRLAHPAVVMGGAIAAADRAWNRPPRRRARGVGLVLLLVGAAAAAGAAITALPAAPLAEALAAAVLLAQRSLSDHVAAVARGLRASTEDGRRAVAQIVGRDTAAMQPPDIARAAIESAAENLSDGVVSPVFWFLVAGLPGMLVYKAVNTADSMIGYRTPRHADFGWAAARLDDALNWVPARLTALLIWGLYRARAPWRALRRDAGLHRSPNAGWPEAAMAAALGVALAGPRSYGGRMRDFPFVNPAGRRDAGPGDIDAAVRVLWRVWAALFGAAALMAFA